MINELKLNLACGQRKIENYFGIDIRPGNNVDAVVNLEQYPWPIESESADDIICHHYIEHISMDNISNTLINIITESKTFNELKLKLNDLKTNFPPDGLIAFMDEVYRILKPGGKFKIISPYWSSMRAWQDPTHRRAINEASFLYFNKSWRDTNMLDHYGIKSNFDFVYGYDISPDWVSRNDELRSFAIKNYTNSINDIHVTLTKI